MKTRSSFVVIFMMILLQLSYGQVSDTIRPLFGNCATLLKSSTLEAATKCSETALSTYITKNLVYPDSAKASGIEGVILVQFSIDTLGNVAQVQPLYDIGKGCADAARSLIENMPRWSPAICNGKSVAVSMNLPIRFSLKETDKYTLSWGRDLEYEINKSAISNQLNSALIVRDDDGNEVPIQDISLAYKFKNKKKIKKSKNELLTEEMKEFLQKAKVGAEITFIVTIQIDGQFFEVDHTWKVIDQVLEINP